MKIETNEVGGALTGKNLKWNCHKEVTESVFLLLSVAVKFNQPNSTFLV
jgi:hypothetical protein